MKHNDYADSPDVTIYHGDCAEILRAMPDNSVDSVVTDPPYGLKFMGKAWDHGVPSAEVWREVLRVLKPGGYLLAFAGTRTQHRMACNIEDAGFEIRDMIAWTYGSGFPKSHNGPWGGTALKPALEPITMARKPFSGTVKKNWISHGTGALRVDECRVPTDENLNGGAYAKRPTERNTMWGEDAGNSWRRGGAGDFQQPPGRWPANLIHDGSDEVLATFPTAPGRQGALTGNEPSRKMDAANCYSKMDRGHKSTPRGDAGSAARFFYCAKASKADRHDGADNNHPTVKPTDLMRYLCRLVTPVDGVVLDPFMGSGSTGRGAVLEGLKFIGVEKEREYVETAKKRIAAVSEGEK